MFLGLAGFGQSLLEAMPSSRRFLLLLVLACVTCLVLIQMSMEDKHVGRTLLLFGDAPGAKNGEHVPVVPSNSESATSPTQKNSAPPVIKPSTTSKPPTTLKKSVSIQSPVTTKTPLNKSQSLEPQTQVRRLPLAKHLSPPHPMNENLVNRQERIQEILKQGNTIQRRTALDPMRALKSIPLVNPNKVTRIIVITYFRAGSSFFGDILQQNWKTFYHFEPLHSMTYNKRIDDDKIPEVFDLFNDILTCNFSDAREYMRWVKQPRNQFLFAHNLFLWVTCHSSPKVCFHPMFVTSVCQRSPVHVVKVTRLPMRHLKSYLEENADMNIKVVYLTRDPRGIVSSRWTLDWCNGTNCSDSGVLCREMDEDIAIFDQLKLQRPQNFIKVRYEDLSMNPELETEKLFRFLDLPFSVSVKKFLKSHTVGRKSDDKNPYSTRRNSTSMVLSWRERFTYDQIVNVQSQCEDVLQRLNHSLVTSPGQLPYPYGKPKVGTTANSLNPGVWRYNRNPLAQKYLAHRPEFAKKGNPYAFDKPTELFIANNTNIEVHKTYKIVEVDSVRQSTNLSTDQIT